jgi:hypothetical protein
MMEKGRRERRGLGDARQPDFEDCRESDEMDRQMAVPDAWDLARGRRQV